MWLLHAQRSVCATMAMQMSHITHKVAPALAPRDADEEAVEAPATVHGAPESAQVLLLLQPLWPTCATGVYTLYISGVREVRDGIAAGPTYYVSRSTANLQVYMIAACAPACKGGSRRSFCAICRVDGSLKSFGNRMGCSKAGKCWSDCGEWEPSTPRTLTARCGAPSTANSMTCD